MNRASHAPPDATLRAKGRVIMYDPARRFGFLVDEANKKHFFHDRDLLYDVVPRVGQAVTFEPGEHPRGRIARHVRAVQRPGLRQALLRRLDRALHRWDHAEEVS